VDRRDWFQKALALIAGGATCIAMPRKMPKAPMVSYLPGHLPYIPKDFVEGVDYYVDYEAEARKVATINEWRKLQERTPRG
jgi:hypothetical protein